MAPLCGAYKPRRVLRQLDVCMSANNIPVKPAEPMHQGDCAWLPSSERQSSMLVRKRTRARDNSSQDKATHGARSTARPS